MQQSAGAASSQRNSRISRNNFSPQPQSGHMRNSIIWCQSVKIKSVVVRIDELVRAAKRKKNFQFNVPQPRVTLIRVGSFSFVPPVRHAPPVTEHVSFPRRTPTLILQDARSERLDGA